MNSTHFIFSLIAVLALSLSGVQAQQLVNMEETWKHFLEEEKTSNISELRKPDKSQPANYIKYSLMYANTYFCGDNIESADEMMSEIESMGKEVQDKVPGFEERYEKLKVKVKAYHDFMPLWKRFKEDKNSVSKEDVQELPDAKNVCEKGTLAKYFYMISHDYYCDGDLENSRDQFDNRVRRLMKTTWNHKDVEFLGDELDMMVTLWDGIDELDPAWETFLLTGISPGLVSELPVIDCYVIPNMKACILKATDDLCGKGEDMLKKLKGLQQKSTHPIPSDIIDYIDFIEVEVGKMKKDLAVLNSFWRIFTAKETLPSSASYKHTFRCDREAEIKAYLMDGLNAPCEKGRDALDSISRIRKEHKPDMGKLTLTKFKQLKSLVRSDEKNVAVIEKAWQDFLPDDVLSTEVDFDINYGHCNKVTEIRAYIMDGTVNICTKGQDRLDDIEKVMAEYEPELDEATMDKMENLEADVEHQTKGIDVLNNAWDFFLENNEVSYDFEYDYDFPCDRELEVKAYLLDGYTNPCLSGKYGLEQVEKVIKAHNPDLQEETLDMIEQLKKWPESEAKNVAVLTKAWEDFEPDNKLKKKMNFVFEYCDKIAQIRAYLIDGTINFDEKGKQRLLDISRLQEDYLLTLDQKMLDKLEWLHEEVKKSE